MARVILVMGKGGVGKTTTAAALALLASEKGLRTLLVSLDPAHNLGDVLEAKLAEEPREVAPRLWASEVDFEAMVARHLRQLCERIKDIYGYLRVLNLDRYIDTLRYSPGVEEYAVLEKVMELLRHEEDYDLIVLDTPPTGLTLRMLVLPFVNMVWLEKLLQLRRAILERRKAITRVTGEQPEATIAGRRVRIPVTEEEDPVYRELKKMLKENTWLVERLRNREKTRILIVVNPETLPVLEASRALETLRRHGLHATHVVVNKVLALKHSPRELEARIREQEKALEMIRKVFTGMRIAMVPLMEKEPRGLEMLQRYAHHIAEAVGDLLG